MKLLLTFVQVKIPVIFIIYIYIDNFGNNDIPNVMAYNLNGFCFCHDNSTTTVQYSDITLMKS